jgi:putative transcriptional regulator
MIRKITLPILGNTTTQDTQTPAVPTGSLAGKLLVAAPSLAESCFTRSVIYMCVHNEAGAMGVIINSVIDNVDVEDVLEQLDIEVPCARDVPVHFGGPVDGNRGFIIHSDEYTAEGHIFQQDGVVVTPNVAVLQSLAEGRGPRYGMLALGYAGWSGGQLESELETGSWISVPATKQLVFETENDAKWSLAIASLGFDVGNFSSLVGHA